MDGLKKRDDALDAVKGFAILIVMLGHCIVLNNLADPYFYDAIVAIQMPLFMAVSGFTTGRRPLELYEKPDLKKRLSTFLKRTTAYLVPFFIWLWLTHLTNPFAELKLQLFALDRGLWFLMTLWIVTLVTMTGSYVADYVAWKFGKSTMIKGVLRFVIFGMITSVCYIGFVLQGRSGNTFLSPSLTVKYLPFYVAGYLWALYVSAFIKRYKTICNLLCIVSLCAFVYLIAAFDMIAVTGTVDLLVQMSASFLGVYLCFYGIYHFAAGRLKKLLAFIGQYTLEIYVLHFRFARLLGFGDRGLKLYSLEAIGWVIAAFAVMSLLTAACIFLIKKVKVLDLLLFGKNNFKKRIK